jgi:hypothetical protein
MTETSSERTRRLTDGRTCPVVRVDADSVTVDGHELPLLVAAEPIETRIDPMGSGVIVRLSLLAYGPVIVDQRRDHERNSVVYVDAPDTIRVTAERVPADEADDGAAEPPPGS